MMSGGREMGTTSGRYYSHVEVEAIIRRAQTFADDPQSGEEFQKAFFQYQVPP
mgnify:CR=1 FL=1